MSEKFRPSSSNESAPSPFSLEYLDWMDAQQNSDIETPDPAADSEASVDTQPTADTEPTTTDDTSESMDTSTENDENPIVNRNVVQKGPRASICKVERADGSVETVLESDYHDIYDQFLSEHPDIEEDTKLRLELGGLARDLAFLDATKFDCYEQGNADERAHILDNYTKLRARLESSSTPIADRQVIRDLIDRLQGDAFNYLNSQYEQVQNEGGNNERVNSELGQLHEKVESTQEKYEEAYRNFESMLKTYSDVTSDHSYLEDVPRVVDNLQREIDITVDQAKIFRRANDEFMQATSKSADQLTRDRFEENQKFYKSNEETIQKALKLLSDVENDAQIKKKQALILLGYV